MTSKNDHSSHIHAFRANCQRLSETCIPQAHRLAKTWARRAGVPEWEDDIAHEAFLHILKSAQSWEPGRGASFFTYSTNAASFACMRFVEIVKKRGFVAMAKYAVAPLASYSDVEADTGYSFLSLADPGALDVSKQEVLQSELTAALGTLPPRWRLAVECRYMQGMKDDETGELLGISGSRAQQIIAASLKRLRQLMEPQRKAA